MTFRHRGLKDDGGVGRGGEARYVCGAGDAQVGRASDPCRLMETVPPVSRRLTRGPDRAHAFRHARRGRERQPVHHQEIPLREGRHGWRHDRIQLLPVNPTFDMISLRPDIIADPTIIAECVRTVLG